MKQKNIIIDTDTGVDDALALTMALNSEALHVRAITTVAGNVEVEKCTKNVFRMLNMIKPSVMPIVAQGAASPLKRKLLTAPEVHGDDGLGNLFKNAGVTLPASLPNAVDVILHACNNLADDITIIAIGPLTNLAQACLNDPYVVKNISRIISMGGSFNHRGNTGPVAEFNYYVDPDAAQIVLNQGIPVTIVPLNVTENIKYLRKDFVLHAKRSKKDYAQTLTRLTEHYMKYHKRTEGFYGAFLHDPMAVAAAIKPELLKTQNMHVEIETKGDLTRGMSLAFNPSVGNPPPQMVQIAVDIDKSGFLNLFNSLLWG
jgi:purine nucleosidase/pyrimidine-specific ribonucleoside hydrolase